MFIHDSYNNHQKKVKPLSAKKAINVFVCGPTVYDSPHLGHARTYLVMDALVKYLRACGEKVFYLQNITDFDDKIINRAAEQKIDWKKVAKKYEKEYLDICKVLQITSVDKYARATDHLDEIRAQVKRLIAKGLAYETKNGVYFEVKKFKRYGRLSKQKLDSLKAGYRIDLDPEKKDVLDFALWKKSDEKPNFPSPWGKGRPGWHIEDTAITEKYLGEQYDLHGGGMDLKFPHHEAEIAQEEGGTGKQPLSRVWMHTGFLTTSGDKMSKSSKNYVTVADFLKKHSAYAMRLMVLAHHYRTPLNYTEKIATEYDTAWQKIEAYLHTVKMNEDLNEKERKKLSQLLYESNRRFHRALEKDFNTPIAIAKIYEVIAKAPKVKECREWVLEHLKFLGFEYSPKKFGTNLEKLLKKREDLRLEKKFKEADKIRMEIQKAGFTLED